MEKEFKYKTKIWVSGNHTAIVVPSEIIEKMQSGKRPPIKVSLRNHSYRTTVTVMDGKFMLPLNIKNREAAGVKGNDKVEIAIQLDLEPRNVEVPKDLEIALKKANLLEKFEATTPYTKKEFVRQVIEAKAQETRQRRIIGIIEKLQ